MPAEVSADFLATLSLAGLLLLPGLLVVRAPWTAVPFLSISFWVLSWWLCAPLDLGRERFLQWALVTFLLGACLRLLKPLNLRLPSRPALALVGGAFFCLVPFASWTAAPGTSFASLRTLLLVWHDNMPRSCEPLLPLPFTPPAQGLEILAADVSLLSGLSSTRSLLLMSLAACSLLELALFALLSRFFPPSVAAWAAIASLGLCLIPQTLEGSGGSLAVALLAGGSSLLLRGSPSAAASAGLIMAACLVCDGGTPLLIPVVVGGWACFQKPSRGRIAASLAPLLLAALPFLVAARPVVWDGTSRAAGPAPSPASARALLVLSLLGFGWELFRRGRFSRLVPAMAVAAGLALVLLLPVPSPWLFVLTPLIAVGVALLAARLSESRGGGPLLAASLAILFLLFLAPVSGLRGIPRGVPTRDDLEAMAWIRSHTGALDLVCNEEGSAGVWVPSVAGRAVTSPELPFSPDAFRRGIKGRPCRYTYASKKPHGGGRIVFENASVIVWEEP